MNRYGISPEIAQRLAGSLLHFIWQGALLAFLTAMCLKLLSRRSAEIRYVVASTAMALMLAAPVLTFAFYGQTGAIALRLLQMSRATRQASALLLLLPRLRTMRRGRNGYFWPGAPAFSFSSRDWSRDGICRAVS